MLTGAGAFDAVVVGAATATEPKWVLEALS